VSYKLIPAVAVVIENDHDKVVAFLSWISETHNFAVAEMSGGCGQGCYAYTHPAEQAEAIEAWMKSYRR
jgi:hypothetical protein